MATIIVGFDGSADAIRALRWACDTATAKRLPVRVVTAVEGRLLPATTTVLPASADEIDATRRSTQQAVDQVVADLAEAAPDWIVVVVDSQPATALLEQAQDGDHLVVGSRGAGGFSRLLLGSVSSQVVHHAHCPVTVVPRPGPND